ncbi:MAG: polyprenyl synthetase family protein [Clostridia bacterium]|nr:polyprenyl synthetase family protein [Clostridia bacterium]
MKLFDEYRQMTEQALIPMLSSLGDIPSPLWEAMSYSLQGGGKRIRPVLLLASCDMAGGNLSAALPFACALEMIHTYSLIHDDLPAMDNDDLRRGQPTNHKVFGENIAILAGDGLLNAAAELMAGSAVKMGDLRGCRAMEIIMRHAGVTGMIAGQTEDVTSEGQPPYEDTVRYIHERKTADLLEAAVEAGLALAGAQEKEMAAGREYALHLGMAFQMTDDLLDVTGNEDKLGKSVGKDQEQNKMTWVALRGIDGTREDAHREILMAKEALASLSWDTGFFADFAESLQERKQ